MASQPAFEGMVQSDDYENVSAPHIRIYKDRSALYAENQQRLQIFSEGPPTSEAKNRASIVRQKLRDGFIRSLIQRCREGNITCETLSEEQRKLIQCLDKAVTSETGRAVIAHEAHLRGGVGAEIAAVIADEGFEYLDAPVKRVGAKEAPIPFPSVLEDAVLPQEDDIENAIRELV